MGRDINKLDPLPDEAIQEADKAYLERHQLDQLFSEMLTNIVTDMPQDPMQYVIDAAIYSAELAKQDPITGLPQQRREKLLDLFRVIDKEGTERISFRMLNQFVHKYGGSSLSVDELRSIFVDFKPNEDNLITREEFITFFSRVSRTITNKDFDALVVDMMA